MPCGASQYQEALIKTAETVVKTQGIDAMVGRYVERKAPEALKEFAKDWGFWLRLAAERKVEYKWNF